MAAILGTVRSFLTALPFLRAFTDEMCFVVDQQTTQSWDKALPVPPSPQSQVREEKSLLTDWKGRPMGQTQPECCTWTLQTRAGGGLNVQSGHAVQEFWRDRSGLHINLKELKAAMETVKSLATREDVVHLSVDNSVAYSYLKKWGDRNPTSITFYAIF